MSPIFTILWLIVAVTAWVDVGFSAMVWVVLGTIFGILASDSARIESRTKYEDHDRDLHS